MILVTLCVACFSLFTFFLNLPDRGSFENALEITRPIMAATMPIAQKVKVAPSTPIRLRISKIKVNAFVEPVGLNALGEVGVPKGPTNAAWFSDSVSPGEIGSAIIVGHYGKWKNGVPTVFNHLGQLKKGDVVTTENQDGKITTFVVRELKTFYSADDAFDVFGVNDGKSHLNLITCEGDWNKQTKSYPKRLVVFTDKKD